MDHALSYLGLYELNTPTIKAFNSCAHTLSLLNEATKPEETRNTRKLQRLTYKINILIEHEQETQTNIRLFQSVLLHFFYNLILC